MDRFLDPDDIDGRQDVEQQAADEAWPKATLDQRGAFDDRVVVRDEQSFVERSERSSYRRVRDVVRVDEGVQR